MFAAMSEKNEQKIQRKRRRCLSEQKKWLKQTNAEHTQSCSTRLVTHAHVELLMNVDF